MTSSFQHLMRMASSSTPHQMRLPSSLCRQIRMTSSFQTSDEDGEQQHSTPDEAAKHSALVILTFERSLDSRFLCDYGRPCTHSSTTDRTAAVMQYSDATYSPTISAVPVSTREVYMRQPYQLNSQPAAPSEPPGTIFVQLHRDFPKKVIAEPDSDLVCRASHPGRYPCNYSVTSRRMSSPSPNSDLVRRASHPGRYTCENIATSWRKSSPSLYST
ncbi:unnamed protein product [Trichogramma brassicae]|uniref:Uncharacterized protein n=1 Tax=Trichogramma brassicae TaxID=86971 RepID=A0A6H5J2T6_9HYME|nr:unnamed protein product [Trichogramma brassicae]